MSFGGFITCNFPTFIGFTHPSGGLRKLVSCRQLGVAIRKRSCTRQLCAQKLEEICLCLAPPFMPHDFLLLMPLIPLLQGVKALLGQGMLQRPPNFRENACTCKFLDKIYHPTWCVSRTIYTSHQMNHKMLGILIFESELILHLIIKW